MKPVVDVYFTKTDDPNEPPLESLRIDSGCSAVVLVVVIRQLSAGDHAFRFAITRCPPGDDAIGKTAEYLQTIKGPFAGSRIARLAMRLPELEPGAIIAQLEIDGKPTAETVLDLSRES